MIAATLDDYVRRRPPTMVGETLIELEQIRVIERDQDQRVRPGSGCHPRRLAALMQCYAEHRFDVAVALSIVTIRLTARSRAELRPGRRNRSRISRCRSPSRSAWRCT